VNWLKIQAIEHGIAKGALLQDTKTVHYYKIQKQRNIKRTPRFAAQKQQIMNLPKSLYS